MHKSASFTVKTGSTQAKAQAQAQMQGSIFFLFLVLALMIAFDACASLLVFTCLMLGLMPAIVLPSLVKTRFKATPPKVEKLVFRRFLETDLI